MRRTLTALATAGLALTLLAVPMLVAGIATASADACPGISSSGTTRTPRSVAYFTISRICCWL